MRRFKLTASLAILLLGGMEQKALAGPAPAAQQPSAPAPSRRGEGRERFPQVPRPPRRVAPVRLALCPLPPPSRIPKHRDRDSETSVVNAYGLSVKLVPPRPPVNPT